MTWQQWVLILGPVWSLAIQPVGWIPEVRAALKARKLRELQAEKRPPGAILYQVLRCAWWVFVIWLVVTL